MHQVHVTFKILLVTLLIHTIDMQQSPDTFKILIPYLHLIREDTLKMG